jgi:hypothetical protein
MDQVVEHIGVILMDVLVLYMKWKFGVQGLVI